MRKPDDPIDCTEPRAPAREHPAAPAREADEAASSVYGRWSRRKARARAAPASAPGPADAAAPRQAEPAVQAAAEPARELTDADMPALDALGADDDYSGFLSPGVSEPLRLKALRKLFASSKFNVVDGLDDYAEDFTSFAPLGDIITSDMRHRIELEAERARLAAEQQAREQIAAEGGVEAEAEAGAQTDVLADGSEPAAAPAAPDAAGAAHAGDRATLDEAPTARQAPPDASVASSVAQSTTAPAPRVRDDG